MIIQKFPKTINSPNKQLNSLLLDDFALPESPELGGNLHGMLVVFLTVGMLFRITHCKVMNSLLN